MQRNFYDIKIIGYFLAPLYFISFLTTVIFYRVTELQGRCLTFSFLFILLTISSIALTKMKEWGRALFVVANAVLGIYILYISKAKVILIYDMLREFLAIPYVLLSFILISYFSQSKIKARFQSSIRNKWQSILLVDDDETLIRTVRPVLLSSGYAVLIATTGESGLQIAQTQKPDLIILDVILPGIKGREVCKKIKETKETSKIPVVFLTAKDSPDDIKAEMDAGAEAHLSKPVDAQTLISTIQKVLDAKGK